MRGTSVHVRLVCGVMAMLAGAAHAQLARPLSPEQSRDDVVAFCRHVEEHYAYFDAKATDWPNACRKASDRAAGADSRASLVAVLEEALRELYDHHAHLATHTARSPRLVPSQADVLARWVDGKAVVEDVRGGSAAQRSGVVPGDEIVAVNGTPVAAAAAAFAPAHLLRPDPAARDFALRLALAGRHDADTQRLLLRSGGSERDVAYAPGRPASRRTLTASGDDGVGVLQVHDSLGNDELIRDFDAALLRLRHVSALIVDLRDTPSGGNSTVARGVLGRFVTESTPYQRHERVEEERRTGIRRHWAEHVAPRLPTIVVPVVVLVGRWTGSMGEGLAIGFDAAVRAPVVGAPMAKLRGALDEFELPHSRIVVRLPTEKLLHVDGTPREAFEPCPLGLGDARPTAATSDRELDAAIGIARRLAAIGPSPTAGGRGAGERRAPRPCPSPSTARQ